MRTRRAALAALPVVLLACSSRLQSPPNETPVKGPTAKRAAACAALGSNPSPGASPLRRLTRREYDNTVRDLLGLTTSYAADFVPEEKGAGFDNGAQSVVASPLLIEQYQAAAEKIAARAAANLSTLLTCDHESEGDVCIRRFIESFGVRAYRRPLEVGEVERLFEVYALGRDTYDLRSGVEMVLEVMLQSPHFLYRVELEGSPVDGAPGIVRSSDWEVASRLSYFFWGTLPDQELFDAARRGKLRTKAQILAQAERMLDDEKSEEMIRRFFFQWLDLEALEHLERDPAVYAGYTDRIGPLLLRETEAFTGHVVRQDQGTFRELLTASYSFANEELARFQELRVRLEGDTFVRVDRDPTQFAGLLTLASVMTRHSHPLSSSPVRRGKLVRERLLCQPLPSPPDNVSLDAPDVVPTATTRDRLAQHVEDDGCATCHRLMDPLGLAFEHYDAVGRWRDEENGKSIDASGELVGTDVNGRFYGAVELSRELAKSEVAQACFVAQWFQFAAGRTETAADACTSFALLSDFVESGGNVRRLLLNITQTDAFLYRNAATP